MDQNEVQNITTNEVVNRTQADASSLEQQLVAAQKEIENLRLQLLWEARSFE